MKKRRTLGITVLSSLVLLFGCQNGTLKESETVHTYIRDASSGTRESIEKQLDFTGEVHNGAIETNNNGDMLTKVTNDVSSIGYVSFDTPEDNIAVVPIDGVVPTIEHVLDKSYPLQRPYMFVSRAEGDFDSTEKEALVDAFLAFCLQSTEGRMLILQYGGIVSLEGSTSWEVMKKDYPIVERKNIDITLITAGSTSVEPVVKALLEAFQPLAGDFNFVMNQSGSSDGYKRVLGSEANGPNRADIGYASRSFKEEEDVSKGKDTGILCVDAIKVIVHKDNPFVEYIQSSDIRKLYTGEYTTWKEVIPNE